MKPRMGQWPEAALTLWEVGVVIAVGAILAVVFATLLSQCKRAGKITCSNHLMQVRMSYRLAIP